MAVKTSKEVVAAKFHELGFAEFAELAKPSAAVVRLPGIGGDDVLIYEVFLNGKAAKALGPALENQRFQGELLHGVVEKLGLDVTSFRDTIKTAELMAVRHAWQQAVHAGVQLAKSQNAAQQEVGQKVLDDWQLVMDFKHPVMQMVLKDHAISMSQLEPALKTASLVLGVPVVDKAPQEVNRGTIVSQNGFFTVMDTGQGEIVTHANKQLQSLPRVNDDVTIAYYRGQGQVFANREVEITSPYLHEEHADLAITVTDKEHGRKQVLLFNGISPFMHFANANGLGRAEIEQAIDLLAERSEKQNQREAREPMLPVGVDPKSGALSLRYKEKGVVYTALFLTEEELLARAADFDLDRNNPNLKPKNVAPLARPGVDAMREAVKESEAQIRNTLAANHPNLSNVAPPDKSNPGPISGPVVASTAWHVAQDIGRGRAKIHVKTDLDKVPAVGDRMSVTYRDGRGSVQTRSQGQQRGQGR
ncbi:MAG TPA: hypothetical protein VF450_11695 [Noviherbaspirillum sp.]